MAQSDEEMDEAARKKLAFWDGALAAAFEVGSVVIETYTCECGMKNFLVHAGIETMKCIGCDKVRKSKTTNPPKLDAETAALPLAIRINRSVHEEMQKEQPALSLTEILQQSDSVRLLLARHRSTVAIETLKKVVALSEELAARE